ncbi:MAG: manganese efflux pump, partial [Oscillospiraceae bacterium]|nr:manganese efflux pump [Oscillospiraceae bacterium]
MAVLDRFFLINSIGLGAGLAMDAFSVCVANGLREPEMPVPRRVMMAGIYAFFQFAMPLIGWVCVHFIEEAFSAFRKFIPWIALLLLIYIGGGMIIEAFRNKKETQDDESGGVKSAALLP